MIKNATKKSVKKMSVTKTLLNYQGKVEYETINLLLTQADSQMERVGINRKLKKRTYHVIAEFLENIQKHADFLRTHRLSDSSITKSRFTFQQDHEDLILTTGNVIFNKNIRKFQDKLDRLNQMDVDGLKRLHSYCIANGELSNKGGAGLGFIEVVMRSKSKISYNFKPLDDKISYCILQVKISKQ